MKFVSPIQHTASTRAPILYQALRGAGDGYYSYDFVVDISGHVVGIAGLVHRLEEAPAEPNGKLPAEISDVQIGCVVRDILSGEKLSVEETLAPRIRTEAELVAMDIFAKLQSKMFDVRRVAVART